MTAPPNPNDPALDMETAAADEGAAASPMDPSHAPLLLFNYGRDQTTTAGRKVGDDAEFFFYSIPKKHLLTRRVDEIRDHRYWTTPQGWLLMAASGSPDMFLWDPYTGARISLPPDREGFFLGKNGGHARCLLSRKPVVVVADAADPDCAAVDVLVLSLEATVFWYCRVGRDERWLRHEYDELPMPHNLSTLNCRFVMMFFDKVVTLELSQETVVFTEIRVDTDPASSPPYTNCMCQLVESRGDLFCVRFLLSDLQGRIIDGIVVYKLDLPARVWVKAELLDGRVFIVHIDHFGASLDPHDGLKGDCIYYCMPGDKAVYVYNMGRGTTTSYNPGSCLLDHHSPKTILMPLTC